MAVVRRPVERLENSGDGEFEPEINETTEEEQTLEQIHNKS